MHHQEVHVMLHLPVLGAYERIAHLQIMDCLTLPYVYYPLQYFSESVT